MILNETKQTIDSPWRDSGLWSLPACAGEERVPVMPHASCLLLTRSLLL